MLTPPRAVLAAFNLGIGLRRSLGCRLDFSGRFFLPPEYHRQPARASRQPPAVLTTQQEILSNRRKTEGA